MKSGRFHEIWWISYKIWQISPENLIIQVTEHKLFSSMVCREEAMPQEIRRISSHMKDQLPGMVRPMFLIVVHDSNPLKPFWLNKTKGLCRTW